MGAIRPPAVAGMFYPSDAVQLSRDLAGYLAKAGEAKADRLPKAIIAPHAGYIYSGPVAATAYAPLRALAGRVARVVLFGPSHRVAFQGIAAPTVDAFRTPLGDIPLDEDAFAMVADLIQRRDDAHQAEHSLEVHLPFLQSVLGAFKLAPFVAGSVDGAAVAAVLDRLWGGDETLIVVSTDLSHYHDYDTAQRLDGATAAAIEAMEPSALGREQACGRVPVAGILTAGKRRGMTIERLDLRNSGDTAGSRDRVVGYGAWALYEPPAKGRGKAILRSVRVEKAPAAASPAATPAAPQTDEAMLRQHGAHLVRLAIASINYGLEHGRPPAVDPNSFPPPLRENRACFVTLKRGRQLRGCIGSLEGHQPLARDVVENAWKAAFRDPRFPPLQAEERDGLSLSISVLSRPSPMRFKDEADLLAQLRPGVDGLIIRDAGRRSVFLPQVWEDLPDKREFLTRLKLKAGLAADHWSPSFHAERFTATSVAPAPSPRQSG
ncbi:MAG: AmmeMemoRadiSam system protein B [Alphaproteobacteria bacterium]